MPDTPTPETVADYAAAHHLDLDDPTIDAFAEQFTQQDQLLATLDDLEPAAPPDREHWTPTRRDDPLGMWLTQCSITNPDPDGPLNGMTVGIKDNIAVAGLPMTCGSPLLADHEYTPRDDATVVTRLLDAGATITGKTNMDEFAFGGDRDTMRLRLAHNPHDPTRMPGSSSAGSGIAAATHTVDLALGSDTGGSVRFPAAWSGVPGIKPTRGLVSHHGFVQFARTLDHIGILAHDLQTLATALTVIAGDDPADPWTTATPTHDYSNAVDTATHRSPTDLTIGLPTALWGNAPDLDDVTRNALETLESNGATLTDVTIENYELWLPAWIGIGMTEAGNYLDTNTTTYWHPTPGDPDRTTTLHDAATDQLGNPLLAALLYADHRNDQDGDHAYINAHRARKHLTHGIDAALDDVDVLAATTVPSLAPRWDDDIDDVFGALAHTGPFNVSGHPAISVPCGTVDDLPVGLQFVAPHHDDATALRAATHWLSHDAAPTP